VATKDNLDLQCAAVWAGRAWIVRVLMKQFDRCIYHLVSEGRCIAADSAFSRWLGRPKTEVLGLTVFDYWPDVVAKSEVNLHQ
jgi:hypothetical protein